MFEIGDKIVLPTTKGIGVALEDCKAIRFANARMQDHLFVIKCTDKVYICDARKKPTDKLYSSAFLEQDLSLYGINVKSSRTDGRPCSKLIYLMRKHIKEKWKQTQGLL